MIKKEVAIIEHNKTYKIMSKQTSLDDLLESFINGQDVALSSKKTYQRQARQFVFWLEDTGRADRLSTLLREDILDYKEWLTKSGKTSATVSGYLTLVRKFFEWLEAEKIYPNVARGVKGLKKPKGFRKDCLTPSQIREALDYFDCSTLEGLRDYALFNLMVRTGLRTIEVARAGIEDLRQESGEAVLWIQGKGRDEKDDFVLLVEDTLKPIQKYLSVRGDISEDAPAPLFASLANKNHGQAMTTRSIRRISSRRRSGLQGWIIRGSQLTLSDIRLSHWLSKAAQLSTRLRQWPGIQIHGRHKSISTMWTGLLKELKGSSKYRKHSSAYHFRKDYGIQWQLNDIL